MRRRIASSLVVVALVAAGTPEASAQAGSEARPVIFVHGMGTNAADIGVRGPQGQEAQFGKLTAAIASRYPRPGVCQRAAQPDRPWDGSPCVFRYIEDAAEARESGEAARGPNDSQSGVRPNADKLAREVAEVNGKAGRRVVLIGYSMGGAIIRTYLAAHRRDAERRVGAVILIDAAASGSWGYAFTGAVPHRVGGAMGERISELLRALVASTSAVDYNRPASQDLRPRSPLFRAIAEASLPRNISYYTFWGDIRIVIERRLLPYELPAFSLPSFGDLALLPGDPDPRVLPELGGQRFSPPVDDEHASLDIPHTTRVRLGAEVIGDLIAVCGHKPQDPGRDCARLVSENFDIPNVHTAVPVTLDHITVDEPALGGRMTLLEAVLEAMAR